MSASQYRGQLERKRKQRAEADKKAGELRSRESAKRAEGAKARVAAGKTNSLSTANTKLRAAESRDREAAAAGKKAAQWQTKASKYEKEEVALMTKLSSAEQAEAAAAERKRTKNEQRASADRDRLAAQLKQTETAVEHVVRELRTPKPENLRLLMLGASAEGNLRIGREQQRIRAAVEAALHRDQLEFDMRPAATAEDLLDGITKFRPHVVHFSGHSNAEFIAFEDDLDQPHERVLVTARAFANAVGATDEPPLLVLLNACNSAAQIEVLVAGAVPLAIGMADEIGDTDAIVYAARFYASVANGQSVAASHRAGQVALELAGLESAALPTLASAAGVDPAKIILVRPPTT